MNSSYYVAEINHDLRIVFLVDLDKPDCKSVTNDAEHVWDEVQATYPGYRLVYRDTMGRWDEIEPLSEWSVNFKPYHGETPDVS